MSANPRVVTTGEWDTAAVRYMKPRVSDRGLTTVSVISGQTGRSLYLSTPLIMTWGVSDYVDEKTGESDGKFKMSLAFPGADYWQFVDEGVKGALSSAKAPRSPFRFGSGTGPSGRLRPSIDKWVVRKGIAPRGGGGQFASRKSMVYAITRSVYQTGIRPSYFFTNAYDRTLKKYSPKLEKAVADDIGNAITTLLNDGGTV